MSLKNHKITLDEESVKGRLISNLENRPKIPPNELKAYFDYLPITVLGLTKLNGLIDELVGNGAEEIGGRVSGLEGHNVQELLVELKEKLFLLYSAEGADNVGTNPIEGYSGKNVQSLLKSIADFLTSIAGEGRVDESVKGNAEDIFELDNKHFELAGIGRVAETVKGNAEDILTLKGAGWSGESVKERSDVLNGLIASCAAPSGIAMLDEAGRVAQNVDASKVCTGVLPLSVLPDAVHIRNVAVETFSDALLLTIDEVQNGDFVVVNSEIAWYQVVDDSKLGTNASFRKVPTGVIGQAIMTQQYDPTYRGGNSIALELESNAENISQLAGIGRVAETVKGNAVAIASLAGEGRTEETVHGNAVSITNLQSLVTNLNSSVANKANLSTRSSATLLASGWTGTIAPFSITIAVSGVATTSIVDISLAETATLAQFEAFGSAIIQSGSQGENSITLKAWGDKPTINIPILIIVRGG